MTHIKKTNEMFDNKRFNPYKNIFFAVVVEYDKNGKIVFCNEGLRDTAVKLQAMPLKISTSRNFATELGAYNTQTI